MYGLRILLRSRRLSTQDRFNGPSVLFDTLRSAVALGACQLDDASCSQISSTYRRSSSADHTSVTRLIRAQSSFAACGFGQTRSHVSRQPDMPGSSVWLRQFSSMSAREQRQAPHKQQTLSEAGWTREAVYNIPNALSMARLVSGPAIAWLILNEQWGVALVSLAVSGATDWADGYVAKHYGQSSVLGSYLDPLADKVLIGFVVGALGYQGSLPWPLVGLIIGRDVVLLCGAFVHRFRMVGWRWPGAAEFFRVASSTPSAQSSTAGTSQSNIHSHSVSDSRVSTGASSSSNSQVSDAARSSQDTDNTSPASVDDSITSITSSASLDHGKHGQQGEASTQTSNGSPEPQNAPPAVFVQPLYISKVNTCFQLLLVSGCLTSSWYAWPPQEALFALGVATGGTTLTSCGAYLRAYLKGTIK